MFQSSLFLIVILHSQHRLPTQILKDGTEYFSRSSPNLATVIPAMDHIDTTFTNIIQPTSAAHPAIRYALRLAKKTLNKYYSLTDEAEVYRIAMSKSPSLWLTICPMFSNYNLIAVLHPQHKLEYFHEAGWESDWVDTAESLVRDEFELSYTATNSDSEHDDSDEEDEQSLESENETKKVCADKFTCFAPISTINLEIQEHFRQPPCSQKTFEIDSAAGRTQTLSQHSN